MQTFTYRAYGQAPRLSRLPLGLARLALRTPLHLTSPPLLWIMSYWGYQVNSQLKRLLVVPTHAVDRQYLDPALSMNSSSFTG